MTDPYREETPDGWSDRVAQTWEVEDVTDGLRLFGDCPTCRHPSETRVVVIRTAPGARPGLDLTRPEPVLVVCECAEEHEGRPAGRTGCGRAAYLELVTDQP
ncbi:hypothetical protein [Actinoplanes regularis]|uniref:hypothetical protein n=1 Tax=Actinoplanes regularis TaxID=52697 RepID=UPI0025531AB8|nr:hypothetical protein [Actinoplanes regularis]GLW31615.1 hypothetical protein Areg01_45550 [Actinoplanes regularis]